MLYQFPPPDWFEAGTTSHLVSQILMWCLAIGLPGSIAVLWFWQPRTKLVWIVAMLFWMCALGLSIVLLLAHPRLAPVFPNTTPYLNIAAGLALLLLPIPALAAGLNELPRTGANPKGFRQPRTWGFATATMIAGFVVLTILFPSGGHPAWTYHASQCKHNLKQLGLVLHKYLEEHGQFPDAAFEPEGFSVRSWRVEILPFVDQNAIYKTYHKTETWDSPSNLKVAQRDMQPFPPYYCPAVPVEERKDAQGRWYSAYAVLNGPHSAFPNGKGLAYREFADGTSNTALIVESCGQKIVWTEPRDVRPSSDNVGINLPGHEPGKSSAIWSSYHRPGDKGAYTLLADGSVRFLSANTDPRVLQAISTRDGGESESLY